MESLPSNESIEGYKDLGLAIELEGEAREESIRLAEEIRSRAECVFTLANNIVPHITLLQGRFPDTSIIDIRKIFEGLNASALGELEMEDELFFMPNGNVFWNVKNNELLQSYYEELNKKLFPLTGGLLMDQFADLLKKGDLSEEDRKQIERYGNLLAGTKFLPHVTLGRLKNPKDKDLLIDIDVHSIGFKPSKLILGNLGYFGEVKST